MASETRRALVTGGAGLPGEAGRHELDLKEALRLTIDWFKKEGSQA